MVQIVSQVTFAFLHSPVIVYSTMEPSATSIFIQLNPPHTVGSGEGDELWDPIFGRVSETMEIFEFLAWADWIKHSAIVVALIHLLQEYPSIY